MEDRLAAAARAGSAPRSSWPDGSPLQEGLPDARITSDVKHIEVGLTDKSDSIAFLMQRLAPARAIRPDEVLIAGDEFGPIAGFEGSDYRMVTRLAAGATMFSVGSEPNGEPTGVITSAVARPSSCGCCESRPRVPPAVWTIQPPPGRQQAAERHGRMGGS